MGDGDGGLTASIAKYLPNEIIIGFSSETLDQEKGKTTYFQQIETFRVDCLIDCGDRVLGQSSTETTTVVKLCHLLPPWLIGNFKMVDHLELIIRSTGIDYKDRKSVV